MRSWFGPGRHVSVEACDHGPMIMRLGQVNASNVRKVLLR